MIPLAKEMAHPVERRVEVVRRPGTGDELDVRVRIAILSLMGVACSVWCAFLFVGTLRVLSLFGGLCRRILWS